MEVSHETKPVILLLHGGMLSSRMNKDLVPLLSEKGYQVVNPDLPGHGTSKSLGEFSFLASRKFLLSEIRQIKSQQERRPVVIVGVSLGGQVVLDLIAHQPHAVDAAFVSGVPINPPDDAATWEMPHMPTSAEWTQIFAEDVAKTGLETAQHIQEASFSFSFNPPETLPPVLVMVGEHDIAMAKRDFQQLSKLVREKNQKSGSKVLDGAWHNHQVDVPQQFAQAIDEWVTELALTSRTKFQN